MSTKVYSELTEGQKEMIRAIRATGKSIKAIAKQVHISDKRISAYLRPLEEQKRKHEVNKKLFNRFVKLSCTHANESACRFVESMTDSTLELIRDILSGKKNKDTSKEVLKSLDRLFVTFLDAAMQMAVMTFWTIPAKYKKLWFYNICEDPMLNGSSKGQNKKGKGK